MCFIQLLLIGKFLKVNNLVGLPEFHIALSEILLTAWADNYN